MKAMALIGLVAGWPGRKLVSSGLWSAQPARISAPPTTIMMAVTDGPSTRPGRQRTRYTDVCSGLKQEGVLSTGAYAG
jgi:hypothetical protein